ncbi:hypothetical protein HELRODRAFT_107158 [Helobdella robusta]|uniref:Bicarbonate transporter-like transmembrane domain-containing protein n=1 Tax=Helobdella robusta TaxID=6412 RepID=T1EE80_HELRO|nr:hypothetical protein HELRODRAFT_107158 [Helobdella robusta]ESN99082.1 hypothetical protein HELRODRAFT_107158 [Helobdella robusta]
MKDFAAEIRAHLDVEHFLNQAQLMLDMQENNMSEILDVMLKHLLGDEESATAYIEAKKVLFTRDAGWLLFVLAKTIQCTCSTFCGSYDYDPSWVCVLCTVSSVQRRHVAIARLRNPANFGRTSQEVLFIILVVTSTKEKGTKTALETGRTFATLFADVDLRLRLLGARNEQEFKQLMWEHMKDLAEEQQCMGQVMRMMIKMMMRLMRITKLFEHWMGSGLMEDWKKRAPHYLADYTDGFCGQNTLHKTLSTTFFLYFACILPAIALGVLYYNNTSGPSGEGQIDVRKVIYSQTISGLTFAVFGGQPMVILLTTAPLAIYTKVIFNICEDLKLDFAGMFACTGLWNSFFLLIYAFTDASKLMRWCTRSTEEIFALFISLALAVDAFRNVFYDFRINYHSPACYKNQSIPSSPSLSSSSSSSSSSTALLNNIEAGGKLLAYASECSRENSLLYLLLMLGTAWLGLSLYNFTKTPFLNASKRELMADCALPVSVLLMSFFGSYLFRDVKLKKFKTIDGNIFTPAPLSKLEWPAILGGMGLGFCLSLLFFMDHYIAGALVNSTDNRLKKGSAYHWDLMIIGLLNAFLSFFGLPLVHGALPHSPLHVRAMADVEDRVYQGHVYLKIIKARETRVTGICSHILIGLSLFYIEELKKIPRPVLDGLFLYLAITALHSNQLFERIMLMFTEQAAYPPNHYIRTVPQRKVHLFTLLQLLQLAVLCGFGFSSIPYLKMVFPILHLVMLPIRHKLVPYLIEKKYLQSLDGH